MEIEKEAKSKLQVMNHAANRKDNQSWPREPTPLLKQFNGDFMLNKVTWPAKEHPHIKLPRKYLEVSLGKR